jgi:hypothetical protein
VVSVVYPLPPSMAATDPVNLGQCTPQAALQRRPPTAATDPTNLPQCCRGELVIGSVGAITVKNNVSQASVRPGFGTCINSANEPIRDPFRISDATLQVVMRGLASVPGQTAGAVYPPTDQMAARVGFGTSYLNEPVNPPGSTPLGFTSLFTLGDSIVKNWSQTNQTDNVVPQPPPVIGEGG